MSTDILSNYYSNFLNNRVQPLSFSPQRTYSKLNNNLLRYGILLSEANILKLNHPKNKQIKVINLKKYNSVKKSTSSLKNTTTNQNSPTNTINISETNYTMTEKNTNKSRNNTINHSRKKMSYRINNNSFNKLKTNTISFFPLNKNLNSKSQTKNNLNYNINNNIEAEKIVNELMSLKNEKEILNYYKNLKEFRSQQNLCEKINNKKREKYLISGSIASSTINPMKYIKYNLTKYPYDTNKYLSFDDQVQILGGVKNRNNLLDGINDYELNIANYVRLKGPTGQDIKNNEKKFQSEKMHNIICCDIDKKFYFNKEKNFYKKHQNKKRMISLGGGNYKNIEKFFRSFKEENDDIDKKDEFIRKHKNFISFDYRLNYAFMRTKKTLGKFKKRKMNMK